MADLPLRASVADGNLTFTEVPWTHDVFTYLRYELRAAYAAQCLAGGTGFFGTQAAAGNAGSMTDTYRTQRYNVSAGNNSPGVQASDYPGYPGTGSGSTTVNFNHNRANPAAPSNDLGVLTWTGSAGSADFKYTFTESDIDTRILTPTLYEMKGGTAPTGTSTLSLDYVGTYQIATASPGTSWNDRGVVFTDTRYQWSQQYRLYLRTSATTPTAPTDVGNFFLYRNGTGFKARNLTSTGDLIQNYLLPLLNRKIAGGALRYVVQTASTGGSIVGTMYDTRLTGTSSSQTRVGINDYRSYSTPSGSSTIINTYYLHRY